MNQSFKWKKLDFIECGENYSINLETAEIRNDISLKILKPYLNNHGYYKIGLRLNGKRKIYKVHQLVWFAHNSLYDTNIYVIDHINHIKTDNRIENLRLVSQSLNNINRSQMKGKQFDYKSDLPDKITINEECKIYYCKQFDKFYRKVVDGQYREIREYKRKNCNTTCIEWQLNNKRYTFITSNYRALI